MARKKKVEVVEEPVVIQHTKTEEEMKNEQRLIALYSLQMIDSQIDKIKIVRGELPLEVEDLEDEIAGLETRMNKSSEAIEDIKTEISNHEVNIKESATLVERYNKQLDEVKNNREYDALSKEIELQNLESKLSEKKIAEARAKMPAHLQERLEFFGVGIETFFAPEKYDTVLLAWSL